MHLARSTTPLSSAIRRSSSKRTILHRRSSISLCRRTSRVFLSTNSRSESSLRLDIRVLIEAFILESTPAYIRVMCFSCSLSTLSLRSAKAVVVSLIFIASSCWSKVFICTSFSIIKLVLFVVFCSSVMFSASMVATS